MQSLKHVGRIKSTKKKVLVAYRTLPGDAYNCLVIPTESLNDDYHNAVINMVESPTAQSCYELAEALDRSQFSDGSRMLPSLHSKGLLLKVPTDQVEMTPNVSVAIILSELNQIIAEQRGVSVGDLHIAPEANDRPEVREVATARELPAEVADVAKTTSSSVNESAEAPAVDLTPEAQAKEYRSKADKLAKEAAAFRRMAEELVPTKKKTVETA